MNHIERVAALILTLSALWLSGCATVQSRGSQRAKGIYANRISDCKDWFYDRAQCRQMYGCTRHMNREQCGRQMLRILNDPVKLADLF
ncbi:MAG: hypothetical protein COB53_11225 [Elusimicrobia bacterium]|nr:MAG: hypothetical protein COB53_11225 [Elusimicrobiota bacterium]